MDVSGRAWVGSSWTDASSIMDAPVADGAHKRFQPFFRVPGLPRPPGSDAKTLRGTKMSSFLISALS